MAIYGLFYLSSGTICLNSNVSSVELLYLSLRLDCFFDSVTKLHFIVMILQDLLDLEGVLMPAEGF